jgi:hypothetical protein
VAGFPPPVASLVNSAQVIPDGCKSVVVLTFSLSAVMHPHSFPPINIQQQSTTGHGLGVQPAAKQPRSER